MNRVLKVGGLFARQKVTATGKNVFQAGKQITRGICLVSIAAMVALSSCDKKAEGQVARNETERHAPATGDTVNTPKVNFNRNRPSFLERRFNPLFFNDSLRYPDFFHRDFFMKRYELNDPYLRETMKSTDSIKNDFFREHSKIWKGSKDV